MHAKILIVDDNEAIRTMIKTALKQEGFEVIDAVNGREGLKIAEEQTFDCVISDLKMPEMDGLEFIEELRKLPHVSEKTPVIIFTSVTQDYLKAEAHKKGATIVIPKDEISPTELIATIKHLIH